MILKYVSVSTLLFLFMISCATTGGARTKKSRMIDCTKKTAEAITQYNTKRYSGAKTTLETIKIQCNGSSVMDTALYYLGMSDLKLKKYIEARTEFELLVQDYPNSVFFDEAKFRIPYAVYSQAPSFERDQKDTYEAIRLFRDLLESGNEGPYMDSVRFYYKEAVEKIAKKEFTAARFYEKLDKYEAAVVCYRTFIEDYPESKYTDQAQLNMISSLLKLDRKSEAQEIYENLVSQNKNPDLVNKAKAIIEDKGENK